MINALGKPYTPQKTYAQYQALGQSAFIGKGTLENVLTARIGNISSAIDLIQGEVI